MKHELVDRDVQGLEMCGTVEDFEDPTHIGMGQGHGLSPVQRKGLPSGCGGPPRHRAISITIIFNIHIVNNINVEYIDFSDTGRGGLFEGVDMTTQTIRSEITGTVW